MRYPAIITHEGDATLAEFPDCPGCQTFSRPSDDDGGIETMAREALELWISGCLNDGEELPVASSDLTVPEGGSILQVEISPALALKIGMRQARKRAGLTQSQLAERAGVTQQQVARLESPDSNPTLDLLERIARALGVSLSVEFVPSPTASATRASASGRQA